MNRINNLPPGILEKILCSLPIQEVARTSILSREWRYLWIKIPKLVFIEDKFQVSTDGNELSVLEQTFNTQRERIRMSKRRKLLYAINQVLSMHEGPIHEVTLSMVADDCDEIDHMLSRLAQRNTIKKLKIHFDIGWYKLPLSVFSFHQLTDLCLEGCFICLSTTIDGFGSLTRLSLQKLFTFNHTLLHLLCSCRFLKSLTLGTEGCCWLFKSYNMNFSIINLFECLPVVETLSIVFRIIQLFYPSVHARIPREFPTALIHLKYLTINGVSFSHKDGLPILVLLIKSSPNLEKLKIDNGNLNADYNSREGGLLSVDDICSFTLKDYADIWLEHLNELHIGSFKNKGNELNFVKLILAKSPVLKKVMIYLDHEEVAYDEELQICKALLSSPRASPVVCGIV